MATQTYNQAILELAQTGTQALNTWAAQFSSPRTAAQQSHYLCSWMVESLKTKRFSKLVADDLTMWIRTARSQGAGAQLAELLANIERHYQVAQQHDSQLGTKLEQLLETLEELDWLVIADTTIDTKLKLNSEGQSSLVVCADVLEDAIKDGELIKSILVYVRGNEAQFAKQALAQGLLVSQGNKKASLIKHHKAYQIGVANQLKQLCLLTAQD
ncbi:DUF2913 family protein [Shewanella sp. WXL01]|uniref:DUF2913 family protein n=1 Tax=Shewanella sp. WXL01 TaxID=2709721 RepID=UPI0014384B8F|nr:DUF2913 family protein [Shewanella sp. WXL01]NKF49808.1 DUF2913 family protein [Shewanella sp. WXL01]